jgi:hypothetical protein
MVLACWSVYHMPYNLTWNCTRGASYTDDRAWLRRLLAADASPAVLEHDARHRGHLGPPRRHDDAVDEATVLENRDALCTRNIAPPLLTFPAPSQPLRRPTPCLRPLRSNTPCSRACSALVRSPKRPAVTDVGGAVPNWVVVPLRVVVDRTLGRVIPLVLVMIVYA